MAISHREYKKIQENILIFSTEFKKDVFYVLKGKREFKEVTSKVAVFLLVRATKLYLAMNRYNYKKTNLRNGFHLLGFLLLLSGLFVLASLLFIEAGNNLQKTIWVGATSLILGMVILNIYEGTEINLNTHKIRDYFSFCGIKTGQWKELPQVEDIKIVPIEQKTTNIPNGISPTFYNIRYSYEVLLFCNADHPVYTFSYSNKSMAIKKAELLSEKLLVYQSNGD